MIPLSTRRLIFVAGCLLWAVAGATSCRKKSEEPPAAPAEAKVAEKRYPLQGEILGLNEADKTLRIRHKEIPGFMPAMTMDFNVSPGDYANAKVGQHIRADLVEQGEDFRLERIWPDEAAAKAALAAAELTLVQDTVSRGREAYREVGEQTPDFALLDQDGKVVESSRFRGHLVMLNFVFTRCPVATMCPASVARFQSIQRQAKERGIANLELVSISLDPKYDTPGVLKEYVQQRMIDTSNYTFLTGSEKAISSLLTQFGVLVDLKGELLNHTLATLLVDEHGKILHRADGSSWTAEEFLERMRKP